MDFTMYNLAGQVKELEAAGTRILLRDINDEVVRSTGCVAGDLQEGAERRRGVKAIHADGLLHPSLEGGNGVRVVLRPVACYSRFLLTCALLMTSSHSKVVICNDGNYYCNVNFFDWSKEAARTLWTKHVINATKYGQRQLCPPLYQPH